MLHACMISYFCCVRLFVTPWTVACQAALSLGILQARILERVAMLWLSLSAASGGCSLAVVRGLLLVVAPLVAEHDSRAWGPHSCTLQA